MIKKKQSLKTSHRNILLLVFGIILLSGFVVATTVISNSGISSGGNITLPADNSITLSATDCDDSGTLCNLINLRANKPESKPYIGWYNSSNSLVGWMGCHYNSTTGDTHQHCSWETKNSTGGIISRFGIGYGKDNVDEEVFITQVGKLNLGQGVTLLSNEGSIYTTNGNGFSFYTEKGRTKGLQLSNGTNTLILNALTATSFNFQDDIDITGGNYLGIAANTSAITCTEGRIYYDGDAKGHYGCNGTGWYRLY